jgi:tripartite-type tricarboxylate transporter receptor subunit TctC
LRNPLAAMRILFLLLLMCSGAAAAQEWPAKPVRMVVPYAAGGLPDTMARILGTRLGEALGQQVVVENRGGAGGISGTEAVAKAAPDGYTLLVADVGQVAINPHVYASLPYDPLKDLVPVTLLGTTSLFLVAHPGVPAANFAELVALARARPGQLNYGSSGTGSIHHLATEALKAALKLDIVHVPYKGMGQAVPALLGGQVSFLFSALPAIESHVKAGKLKLLAISTPKRSAQAPEVPTVAELGVPGYDFAPEIGVLAPAGMAPGLVARISTEIAKAVKSADVSQRYLQLGIEAVGSTPEAYSTRIRAAYERYAQVVKVSGAKAE